MREVYLDNSATTRVSDSASKAVFNVMTNFYGNPSSLHGKGIQAEKIIKGSRQTIAECLGVLPSELYFTSGGTESNNLAIKGSAYSMKRKGMHIITTKVEHPSVINVCERLKDQGFEVTYLDVDSDGVLKLEDLKSALTSKTILVSIMAVNNEVGSIQPIQEAAKIIKENSNSLFHVDAVQAFGKIPLVPGLKDIDLLSISGHKIYGPKGIGVIFIREKTRISSLFDGGGQEKDIRPGTENVPGIAGLEVAAKEAFKNLDKWHDTMLGLKNCLKDGILEEIPDTVLNSPSFGGAPHILNISFLGTKGEILLHALEEHGIYVSTGSACSSHKKEQSHVLLAMGKGPEEIQGAIRFSLSPFLTIEDIEYTIDVLKKEVKTIRKFVRR